MLKFSLFILLEKFVFSFVLKKNIDYKYFSRGLFDISRSDILDCQIFDIFSVMICTSWIYGMICTSSLYMFYLYKFTRLSPQYIYIYIATSKSRKCNHLSLLITHICVKHI